MESLGVQTDCVYNISKDGERLQVKFWTISDTSKKCGAFRLIGLWRRGIIRCEKLNDRIYMVS